MCFIAAPPSQIILPSRFALWRHCFWQELCLAVMLYMHTIAPGGERRRRWDVFPQRYKRGEICQKNCHCSIQAQAFFFFSTFLCLPGTLVRGETASIEQSVVEFHTGNKRSYCMCLWVCVCTFRLKRDNRGKRMYLQICTLSPPQRLREEFALVWIWNACSNSRPKGWIRVGFFFNQVQKPNYIEVEEKQNVSQGCNSPLPERRGGGKRPIIYYR